MHKNGAFCCSNEAISDLEYKVMVQELQQSNSAVTMPVDRCMAVTRALQSKSRTNTNVDPVVRRLILHYPD